MIFLAFVVVFGVGLLAGMLMDHLTMLAKRWEDHDG
jgi:hypothetical protein